jgi:hypothetical protein
MFGFMRSRKKKSINLYDLAKPTFINADSLISYIHEKMDKNEFYFKGDFLNLIKNYINDHTKTI